MVSSVVDGGGGVEDTTSVGDGCRAGEWTSRRATIGLSDLVSVLVGAASPSELDVVETTMTFGFLRKCAPLTFKWTVHLPQWRKVVEQHSHLILTDGSQLHSCVKCCFACWSVLYLDKQ